MERPIRESPVLKGDEQLNKFLFEDVKPSLALRVANTFVLVDDGRIAQ